MTKTEIIDFIEENGPCTYTEIVAHIVKCNLGVEYDYKRHRGYFSSALNDSYGGRGSMRDEPLTEEEKDRWAEKKNYLMHPTAKDSRYLVKENKLYNIKY